VPYGLVILQQSSPLTLAGYFMRSTDYNIFASMQYNSREYIKFKAQMLDSVLTQNIGFETTAQILDTAIQNVTLGKLDTQPFYWSDMIPAGITYASTSYTVSFITTNVFDTVQVYDFNTQISQCCFHWQWGTYYWSMNTMLPMEILYPIHPPK